MTSLQEFIDRKPYSLEFLENHPEIMRRIYDEVNRQYEGNSITIEKSLASYEYSNGGSFSWGNSIEGGVFWSNLFSHEDVREFYKLYGRKNRID